MTERRAAVLAAALWLGSSAVAPAQVAVRLANPLDDIDILPTFGYIIRPGVSPAHLAENIEGFTKNFIEMADFDAKIRAKGMNPRRAEELESYETSFPQDKYLLLGELALLQHTVERSPAPGTGLRDDGVDYDVAEKSRTIFTTRKPLASDFFKKKTPKPEHERGQDAVLKPGELEFKSPKP
jgi:hypothetical protein